MERGLVIAQLEARLQETSTLSQAKGHMDEGTFQATAGKAKAKVAAVRAADLKVFAELEANLGLEAFPNENPEKALFVESLTTRAP